MEKVITQEEAVRLAEERNRQRDLVEELSDITVDGARAEHARLAGDDA